MNPTEPPENPRCLQGFLQARLLSAPPLLLQCRNSLPVFVLGRMPMRTSLVLEVLEERALLATRITELPIPSDSIRLEGITTGPDGNLWYTSFNNGKIGRVTPAGVVTEF